MSCGDTCIWDGTLKILHRELNISSLIPYLMHFKMFTADVFPLPQKNADLVRALVLQMSSEASQESIHEK